MKRPRRQAELDDIARLAGVELTPWQRHFLECVIPWPSPPPPTPSPRRWRAVKALPRPPRRGPFRRTIRHRTRRN